MSCTSTRLSRVRDRQREMRLGVAARGQDDFLLLGGEARHFDDDAVLAQRHVLEEKFSGVIAGHGLRPVGVESPAT